MKPHGLKGPRLIDNNRRGPFFNIQEISDGMICQAYLQNRSLFLDEWKKRGLEAKTGKSVISPLNAQKIISLKKGENERDV